MEENPRPIKALVPDDALRAATLKIVEGMWFGSEWRWALERYGDNEAIRSRKGGVIYCPITALACVRRGGHIVPSWQFTQAGYLLNLRDDVMALIAQAADDCPGHDPDVRAALIKRLGVEEAA